MSVVIPSLRGAIAVPGWAKNDLWRRARAVPSLDLRFADNKSLTDAVTGQNLVTFTRASDGTFVGSDGVLRTAVTNLLLRSEEFDNASWIKLAATVTSNAIAAPNGTNTADLLTENDTTNAHNAAINAVVVNGALCTFSVYAKRNGRDLQLLFGSSDVSGNPYVNFDLANGTVASTSGTIAGAVQAVGDGWYRCSVTATSAVAVDFTCVCGLIASTSAGRAESYAGNSTSGIYLWGAQLEQSSTVGEYIPTTSTINSAPRFDHNPTTGESLGLLVEEQRVNSIRNNTMVGAVAGTPGTLPTNWLFQSATNGLAVSIVGTGTESGIAYLDWKISGTTTALATADISFERAAALTGQAWTSSVYVKLVSGSLSAVTTTFIRLVEEDASINFVAGSSGSITLPTTASLGTQRGSFTRTLSGGATTAFVRTNLAATVSSGATVDITLRIGLPQLEQGAFATSPILTSTAAATRSADVASIGSSAFTSFYNQSEGTMFVEYNRPVAVTGLRSMAATSNGGFDNRTTFRADSGTLLVIFAVHSAAGQATFPLAVTSGANNKAAVAYQVNNYNAAANGILGINDTVATVHAANQLSIGSVLNAEPSCSYIRRLSFWPTRLGNQILQAITQ